ncbi:hypothetical protein C8J56DRAFT_927761 [Mycena floridula]|nr:hypothetical protein C8J56DRAFT_927761 [Mycena floridula]
MFTSLSLFALISLSHVALAQSVDYFNPANGGGSMLDVATTNPTLGEPLNVIISGLSSPAVLTDDGLLNFAKAIGFSTECLGIHLGGPQSADLGDGHGQVNQTIELRQDYGDPDIGTCLESLIGGNHFRVFRQNGPSANSGALFLAVSQEEDVEENHTISPNGYDVGRDKLIAAAAGNTNFGGISYTTTVRNITGLLAPGANGVNHDIGTDGMTVLLTVKIN